MFKIARTVKQIFNAARNIQQVASASINSMLKYSSGSKGYVEDASNEFTFESFTKILPNQPAAKEQIKASAPIFQSVDILGSIGSYKILDSAELRKLIYARFADEIRASKTIPIKAEAVKGINEEFEGLRAQGYDFKSVANLIEQKKGVVVNDCVAGKSSNISSSSLIERMKKLSIAGYLSNYGGESGLRQDIEEVIIKKAACIDELKSMFSITNGLSCENYDGSELVTLVGIEAM